MWVFVPDTLSDERPIFPGVQALGRIQRAGLLQQMDVQRGWQWNICDEHLQGRDATIISIKDQRIAHGVDSKLENTSIYVSEARELKPLDRTKLQTTAEFIAQQSTLKFFSQYFLLYTVVRVHSSAVL
jgi:hypothetical protein